MKKLILGLVVALSSGCALSEDDVNYHIKESGYCEVSDDCIAIATGCPFGCYSLINSSDEEWVQSLLDEYEEGNHNDTCEYSCTELPTDIVCSDSGRCVENSPEN